MQFDQVETIAFDYGQTHQTEMVIRKKFLEEIRKLSPFGKFTTDTLGKDTVLGAPVLRELGNSTLVGAATTTLADRGSLPDTFVPGRNVLFLTLAAALAYGKGIPNIVVGSREIDYAGYPDNKEKTLSVVEEALSRSMEFEFRIYHPVMWVTKAGTWALAKYLGGDKFVKLVVEYTHSCYKPSREELHEWGYGCGICHACTTRKEGYGMYRMSAEADNPGQTAEWVSS
jgi:7-cyano-7-deazaguanine synthase